MNNFTVTLSASDNYLKVSKEKAQDTYCRVCNKTILKTEDAYIIRDLEQRHGKGIVCSNLCVDTWILQKL